MITLHPLSIELKRWATEVTGAVWTDKTKGIVAIDGNDLPCGVLLFDTWTFTTVNVHFAVQNPMAIRRGLFDEGYRYAFEICGLKRIVGGTPADRPEALKIVDKLGWKHIYTLKDGWDTGVDIVYHEYLKEQYDGRR